MQIPAMQPLYPDILKLMQIKLKLNINLLSEKGKLREHLKKFTFDFAENLICYFFFQIKFVYLLYFDLIIGIVLYYYTLVMHCIFCCVSCIHLCISKTIWLFPHLAYKCALRILHTFLIMLVEWNGYHVLSYLVLSYFCWWGCVSFEWGMWGVWVVFMCLIFDVFFFSFCQFIFLTFTISILYS